MLKSKMKNEIEKEFKNLRTELNFHLEEKSEIKIKKDFLATHIPNQIIFKSKILLDILLYSLTDKSIIELNNQAMEIKNLFLRENFENKVRNLILENENSILKKYNQVIFSTDPRIVKGIATGSIPIIIGASIIGLVFPKICIASIVTGLASVLLSGATFKITYDKSIHLANKKIKSDVENYLIISEKIVIEWLNEVINIYQIEFQKFCQQHNIKIENINE